MDYPTALSCERRLRDGRTVTIRPIRAEDAAAEKRFFAGLSEEAKRMRFMKYVREVSPGTLNTFLHVDYDKSMAFVCEAAGEIVGEARYAATPPAGNCEFGVVIADAWHKSGIAGLLMASLIDAARHHGFRAMEGLVLRENSAERRFARALGFKEQASDEPTCVRVVKALA
ncbi:MAG: N-acetyltransferase family protein [Clostridia bacterium]